jgi:hypothetical protein
MAGQVNARCVSGKALTARAVLGEWRAQLLSPDYAGRRGLSFVHFSDRALLPNEAIRDFRRGRQYVIVSVGQATSHDPFDPNMLLASARVRPVDDWLPSRVLS